MRGRIASLPSEYQVDYGDAKMATAVARRSRDRDPEASDEHPSDEELLNRFLREEKSQSQEAFRALVYRHGPMVLGICRRVLLAQEDAEDAFQATFLVLARKAASIRNQRVLAAWLHEVAHRMAVKARGHAVRRRNLERQVAAMSRRDLVRTEAELTASINELRPILHAEVDRLPERYRIPVILSYLEGKTNEEVAELLKWPVGTVKGRLSRARELLRARLVRRGLALSTAFVVAALSHETASAGVVPDELVERTVELIGKLGPRPFPPDLRSGHSESAIETGFTSRIDSLATSDGLYRGLIRRGLLLFLIVALGVATSAAIAASVLSSARFSTLRTAVADWMPSRAASTSCH
jgi:RNA polymerase sigma factor (sigma-70 family)